MKLKHFVIYVIVFCLFLSMTQVAYAAKEEAHKEEPKEVVSISSTDEFISFSKKCTQSSYSENKIFELKCDIDLSGTVFEPIPCFFGEFDGKGHTISGLSVTRDGSRQGLFRVVGKDAIITTLHVRGNVTPGGTECFLGGIAGYNSGRIEKCSFEGTVEGIDDVGGIAGINDADGIITSCTVTGNVNAEHRAGGISGSNNGLIEYSVNNAKVNTVSITPKSESHIDIASLTTDDFLDITCIGGICGYNSGTVDSCNNKADVGYVNVGYNIGGISGINYGYINSCKNVSDIQGRKDAGGICGQLVPYTELDLDSEKLDNVQSSINVLNARINEASVSTANEAGILGAELGQMQIVSDNLIYEIDNVVAQIQAGGIVDTSGLSQAISNFYAEYAVIAEISEGSVGVISNNVSSVASSMTGVFNNLSDLLRSANGELVEIDDISVEKAYEINNGAIENCQNSGSVSCDTSAGGIVGNVAFEISFDVEDTLNASDFVLTEAKESLFAAVRKCISYGTAETKNDNCGCVVGNCDIGVIIDCSAAGCSRSKQSDYVGGIVGNSSGTIMNCSSRAVVSGGKYIGGIAGCCKDIADCEAYTVFESYNEYAGALAGFCTGNASGNRYVDSYPAGIDGISFSGQSDPVQLSELEKEAKNETLFKDITVKFIGPKGKVVKLVNVEFGGSVTDFPEVPMNGDKYWKWETNELKSVYYSTSVEGKYCSPVTTLATGEDVPSILVEGQFYDDQMLSAVPYSNGDIDNAVCAYTINVSGYDGEMLVRLLVEEDGTLYVLQNDGSMKKTAFSTDGRYRLFNLENGGSFVYAAKGDENISVFDLTKIGLAVVAASAVIYLIVKRKKKVNEGQTDPEETDEEQPK